MQIKKNNFRHNQLNKDAYNYINKGTTITS